MHLSRKSCWIKRGRISAAVNAFLHKLVRACPALPYMALGIWLAWVYIAYSGTAWLSDTETDGTNISALYIVSTMVFAIAFIAMTFSVDRVRRLLEKPAVVAACGVLASFGCLIIIAIGPYYLSRVLPQDFVRILFYCGSALSGLGTSAIGLACGRLYGELPPRKAILYAALSHITIAVIYFTVIGSPIWQPVPGGPSLVGILAFVCMPILAALTANLSFVMPEGSPEVKPVQYAQKRSRLPRSYWKLVLVTFVLSIVVVALRSALIEVSPVNETLDNTRLVMLLRMAMAIAFACAAIGVEGERFNFGKIYSVIMAATVALIAFCPLVGVLHPVWSQVTTFMSCVFEFVLWCILAFIVYQKKISPVLVFGFGYGAFMLGSALGWMFGVYGISELSSITDNFALYLVLAAVVLACAFLLFSEKEFDNLFEPEGKEESPLEVLLGDELPVNLSDAGDETPLKKGKFQMTIDAVTARYGLSEREKDVLRLLAMGYSSAATAKDLCISWNTVRTHTRNVYAKLDVHSKQDLIDLVDEVSGGLH